MAAVSLKTWVTKASSQLKAAGLTNHQQEARLLVCHLLGKPTSYLYTHPEIELSPNQLSQAEEVLHQRLAGQPLAWLLGSWEFWGLNLKVSPATLIPRADTESLVDAALALNLPANAKILDLGTGTGALALALKSERPNWQVEAVDLVPAAVELALTNAKNLELEVNIWQSDWWQNIPTANRYDLILSNPPYIHPADEHLTQGDVRYEPTSALVGGADGLAAYREIFSRAAEFLTPQGYLLVEQGYDQATALVELASASPNLHLLKQGKDLGGVVRFSLLQAC